MKTTLLYIAGPIDFLAFVFIITTLVVWFLFYTALEKFCILKTNLENKNYFVIGSFILSFTITFFSLLLLLYLTGNKSNIL
jgi:hypothetical protein